MRNFLIISLLMLMIGCQLTDSIKLKQLDQLALNIDSNFIRTKSNLYDIQNKAVDLFSHTENYKKGLFPNRKYQYFMIKNESVYYNPENDGGNAVWVSMLHPMTSDEMDIIKTMEYLEAPLQQAVKSNDFVVQSYFLSSFSAISCYPFFDVIVYLTPKLDFTKDFKTYYLADPKHNPEKKIVWTKPYLDVAGNGYMISVVAPVYVMDKMIGTIAQDVPLARINEHYLNQSKSRLFVITDSTLIVSANKPAVDFLKIKVLDEIFFTERAKTGAAPPENFKLIENEDPEIKKLGEKLLQDEKSFVYTLHGKKVKFLCSKIPELNWSIVEISEK